MSAWNDTIDALPLQDHRGPQLNQGLGLSIGIGIHCEVETVPGSAILDPARRTFSSFRYVAAEPYVSSNRSGDGAEQVSPIQALAIGSLDSNQLYRGVVRPLKRRFDPNTMSAGIPSSLLGMYNSLGIALTLSTDRTPRNPLLTPLNMQHATYKLLGESLITSMKDTNLNSWKSPNLYALQIA